MDPAMPTLLSWKQSKSSSTGHSRQKFIATAKSSMPAVTSWHSAKPSVPSSVSKNNALLPAYTTFKHPTWPTMSRISKDDHSSAAMHHRWDACPEARNLASGLPMTQESNSRWEGDVTAKYLCYCFDPYCHYCSDAAIFLSLHYCADISYCYCSNPYC
jgi:hypothetical protein